MQVQAHEPTNRVFLNDHFLGYLPAKDWTYSWVTACFPVPDGVVQRGYNEVTIRSGLVAPQFQSSGYTWDDVLFRGVLLERIHIRGSGM